MHDHNDDARSKRLINIARAIEERVDKDGVATQSRDDLENSNLDEMEFDELARFEDAITFLNQMRENIEIAGGHESAKAHADSTQKVESAHLLGIQTDFADPDSFESAKQIGRFEISKVLGQGGFASVFLARDPQLDRLVALKIPKPAALISDEARQRLDREAKAAAVLSHPNIVPVFETGSVGPIQYIASAYCAGQTLSDWMVDQKGEIAPRLAANIVAILADAVQHAHQRGVIHRDIKPVNILLESEAINRPSTKQLLSSLRIADFGLARLEQFDDDKLTRDGAIVGTPVYMSPEQARGEKNVDAKSDIYSLGVVLYELLVGRVPHSGDNQLATLRAVEHDEAVGPRKLRPSIPRDLEAVCLKAISKSREHRYATAHDLAVDLRYWLNGQPVTARKIGSLQRLSRWASRNSLLATALSLAVLSLVVGLAFSLWQWSVAQKNLVEATKQTVRADEHMRATQQMIVDIANLERRLRHLPEFADLRGKVVKVASELQLDFLEREIPDSRGRYKGANVLKELSPLLIQMGELDGAIENIERVLALLEGIENDLPDSVEYKEIFVTRLGQRMNLAGIYKQTGQFDLAIQVHADSLAEPFPEQFDPQRAAVIAAESLREQADLFRAMKDEKTAIETFSLALQRLNQAPQPTSKRQKWDVNLTACRINNALSTLHLNQNRATESAKHLSAAENCIQVMNDVLPGSNFVTEMAGQTALNTGRLHQHNKEFEKSLNQYQLARDTFFQLHQSVPKNISYAATWISASRKAIQILFELQRFEDVTQHAEKVLQQIKTLTQQMPALGGLKSEIQKIESVYEQARQAQ